MQRDENALQSCFRLNGLAFRVSLVQKFAGIFVPQSFGDFVNQIFRLINGGD